MESSQLMSNLPNDYYEKKLLVVEKELDIERIKNIILDRQLQIARTKMGIEIIAFTELLGQREADLKALQERFIAEYEAKKEA